MTDTYKKIIVTQDNRKKRLDAFISAQYAEINRNRSKKLILQGNVYLDKDKCTQPDKTLKCDMIVEINIPSIEDTHIKPEEIPLEIIFENKNLLVINKAANIITHPAGAKQTGTIVNAVLHHCKGNLSGINGVAKPGIVHRLDKDTSGVMIIAKNDRTHNLIANQLDYTKTQNITKIYCAALWGATPEKYGEINKPIAKSKNDPRKQVVTSSGKKAITKYYTIAHCRDENGKIIATAVIAQILTGRTHQIRVHARSIKCPVINDKVYAADFANKIANLNTETRKTLENIQRQMLHATLIRIIIDGKYVSFVANMPQNMTHAMKKLFGDDVENLIMNEAHKIADEFV